jgi:hypothetical protein
VIAREPSPLALKTSEPPTMTRLPNVWKLPPTRAKPRLASGGPRTMKPLRIVKPRDVLAKFSSRSLGADVNVIVAPLRLQSKPRAAVGAPALRHDVVHAGLAGERAAALPDRDGERGGVGADDGLGRRRPAVLAEGLGRPQAAITHRMTNATPAAGGMPPLFGAVLAASQAPSL